MPCPKDFSRTDSMGRAHAGRQRQIQTYVNERTHALNSAVEIDLQRSIEGELKGLALFLTHVVCTSKASSPRSNPHEYR